MMTAIKVGNNILLHRLCVLIYLLSFSLIITKKKYMNAYSDGQHNHNTDHRSVRLDTSASVLRLLSFLFVSCAVLFHHSTYQTSQLSNGRRSKRVVIAGCSVIIIRRAPGAKRTLESKYHPFTPTGGAIKGQIVERWSEMVTTISGLSGAKRQRTSSSYVRLGEPMLFVCVYVCV